MGKVNMSDCPKEVSESFNWTVPALFSFFFPFCARAGDAKRHKMRTISAKNDLFTGWEKMGITTGIPKVQINLIDIQRVGTPIDYRLRSRIGARGRFEVCQLDIA